MDLSGADVDLIADSLRVYLDHQAERYGHLEDDEYLAECDRDEARVNEFRARLGISAK